VVEIFAEAVLLDRALQVGVRSTDDPRICRLEVRAPQPANHALLDHGQELGLQGLREQRDLVEEERALVGSLEQAGLGAPRVREGAPFEAEQLGLQQRLGDSRAVDVDEGAAGAGTLPVDEVGDQALAGSGLALDQDRRQPPADLLPHNQSTDGFTDRLYGCAVTQQLESALHGAEYTTPNGRAVK
jgi:hypothetical protein